jgi:hypothetical protein
MLYLQNGCKPRSSGIVAHVYVDGDVELQAPRVLLSCYSRDVPQCPGEDIDRWKPVVLKCSDNRYWVKSVRNRKPNAGETKKQ